MTLDILLGLSLLAVLVLLRVIFLWGHAQGRLEEYNSIRLVPPEEQYECNCEYCRRTLHQQSE